MQEVELVIGFIQSIGFTGLLIILAIPTLRAKIFGGTTSEACDCGGNSEILNHLKNYYNHDLTAFMSSIDARLEKFEKMEEHLEDMRINGVRIRK